MSLVKVKKALSWYTIEKLFLIFYGLGLNAILARTLGPSEYGGFSYFQSTALLLSFLVNLGLDGILARELAGNLTKSRQIIFSVITARLCGFCLYLIVFFAFWKFNNSSNAIIFISLLTYHFFRIFLTSRAFFEATHTVSMIAKISIFSKLPAILFAVMLLHTQYLKYVFIYLIIDAVLSGVLMMYAFMKNTKTVTLDVPNLLRDAQIYTKEALPVIASLLTSGIFMQIDVIMLKSMVSEHAAGIYSAAMNLIIPVAFLPTIIITIASPFLVKQFFSDKETYEQTCRVTSQLLVVIATLYILISLAIAGVAINLLYGSEFSASIPVFRLLVMSSLITFPAFLYCRILVIERKLKFELIKSVIAAIASIIINLMLIPLWGITGAIIASLISYVLADLIVYSFNSKTKHIYRIAVRSLLFLNIKETINVLRKAK